MMKPKVLTLPVNVSLCVFAFLGIASLMLASSNTNQYKDLKNKLFLTTADVIDQSPTTNIERNKTLMSVSSGKYIPASTERYIVENLVNLKYDSLSNPITCNIWTDPNATTPKVHEDLVAFARDIDNHTKAIQEFEALPDLLKMIKEGSNQDVCKKARLHPEGIQGLFPSNQLSYGTSGYLEPLLPPMRSHKFCYDKKKTMLFNMDYLIHDFEAMCQKLKPTSNIILIDMGASLEFHAKVNPILNLLNVYEKFGFRFDHIYGFEVTPIDAKDVYGNLLPEKYMPSYHWINVGITPEEGHRLNPLHSILKTYGEDDFIVVKLDVDTNSIEVPLAKELLEDKDGVYHKLVDQFYFEHHVHLGELAKNWRTSMKGSIKDSFDLFYGLREKGIPAHFWP